MSEVFNKYIFRKNELETQEKMSLILQHVIYNLHLVNYKTTIIVRNQKLNVMG